jgi:hypothetical protein
MVRLLVLVPLTLAVTCATASAQQTTGPTPRLIRTFDAQGDPQPVVYDNAHGGTGSVAWSMCPADGSPCFSAGSAQTLTAGPTSPGTVIVANGVWDAQPIALRATWLGTVTAVAPPELHGRAVVGTQVSASGATWSGGWGDDLSAVRVQACRTRDARDCGSVTRGNVVTGEPLEATPTIPARYAGWYLFAVDVRRSREAVPVNRPGFLLTGPLPSVLPGKTIAFSAPVGPVVGPTAVLRSRVRYRDGRPQLGRVHCPVVQCTATVTVRHGTRKRTQKLLVTGTEVIAPRARLRPGLWSVTVTIDDERAAQRRVRVLG